MEAYNIDILLVDDNFDDADLTIRAFKKFNISNKITHVQRGAEALDFIFCTGNYSDRQMDDSIKFILLDLKMPGVDGFEVLKKVKADQRTRRIPVIILTSSNEIRDIETCYQLGANSFIVKPVEFDDFIKTVADIAKYWLHINLG